MSQTINLRQFRKRKKREEKEKQADENRKLHGISSHLRKAAKVQNKLTGSQLEGKKLKSRD